MHLSVLVSPEVGGVCPDSCPEAAGTGSTHNPVTGKRHKGWMEVVTYLDLDLGCFRRVSVDIN